MDLFVKNKRYEILIVLVFVVFSSIWLSCGKKPTSNSSSSSAGLGVVEVGDLKLEPTKGSKILSSVNSSLTYEANLTPQQASEITSYAAGALAIKGTQGNRLAFKDDDVRSSYLVPSTVETPDDDTVNPDDMNKVPQTLMRWLVRAINLPSLNDFSLDEKIKILGKISNATMRALYDKKGDLTDEEKNLIPAGMSGSALSSLAKAGLAEGYDLNEGAKTVSSEVIGSLMKAGYTVDSFDSVLENNAEYSVDSLKSALSSEGSASALEKSIEGQVGGLGQYRELGLAENIEFNQKMSVIIRVSVQTISNKARVASDKSNQESQELVKRVAKGSVKTINSVSTKDLSRSIEIIIQSSMQGLVDGGVSANNLGSLVDDIVGGVVSGSEKSIFQGSSAGAKKRGVEKAKTVSSLAVNYLISTITNYGVNSAKNLQEISGSAAEGVTSAFANMSGDNVNKADIQSATEKIGSASSGVVYQQLTTRISLPDAEVSNYLASISTRLLDGLRKASFSRDEILASNKKIASGMASGLSAQGAGANLVKSFTEATDSKLAELSSVDKLKESCEGEKGTWDSKNMTCGVLKTIFDVFEGIASKRQDDILSGAISTVKSVINNIIAKTNQASSSGDTSSVLDSRCEEAKDKVCKFIISPYSYNDAMNLCNCNSNCKWSENYTTRTREKCSQGLASCCILR